MTWCGTPAWTAPEIVRRERYTEQADIFSLGVVLWEVATRELPFASDGKAQVALNIVEGKRPPIPTNVPLSYAALVQACWKGRADKRPSAQQVFDRIERLALSSGDHHSTEFEMV